MSFGETKILVGDCREVLPGLDPVDAVVTDPPYGLGFMGQGWDHGVPGVEFWKHVQDAMKPGAHLLAFGGTRTHHRLAVAIEDAGLEIRDCLMWLYGTGFPKSLDVSKAIDKAAGVEFSASAASGVGFMGPDGPGGYNVTKNRLTRNGQSTDDAKRWSGWGTALKPAWEPIILARKPPEGTVAQNVLTYGTGALNIDACRIGDRVETWPATRRKSSGLPGGGASGETQATGPEPPGRWPANLLHDGSDEVVELFPNARSAGNYPSDSSTDGPIYGKRIGQQGPLYVDTGSAARFFYSAKASGADRGNVSRAALPLFGIPSEEVRNDHPTVKPVDLMRYLCRLVTPPGGTVLDPFMGSGSTLLAASREGFDAIGIEIEPSYVETAERRLREDRGL